MSFGWSAGDVVSGVKLLINILGSLQDANGSRTHFQELESELQGLSRALFEISNLADGNNLAQIPEMRALKFVACSCEGTLKRFYEKIKPFQASLGVQSVSRKVKAAPRMVRWELLMKKEIPELRSYLAAHVGYLNMRLSIATIKAVAGNRSAQNDSTGMVLQQLNHQKLDIFEKINQIPMESTLPKLDSLLLTANKVWKAQEDMMTMISKAMEQLPPPDIRHTWAQAPVTLEDALGRRLPVPSEYDWTMLHAVIQARFREGPGYAKVRSGEYELFMNVDSSKPVTASTFPSLIPGTKVTMYMILGQYAGSERCPRVGCRSDTFERHKEGGSICVQCRTWFRRSSKSLPKPLKPPTGYIIMGTRDSTSSLSQTIGEKWIDFQTASSDRRCYRNVSIYITELPPTPSRFRDKYPRGYENISQSTQEIVTGLQRASKHLQASLKTPRVEALDSPLQDQFHPKPPPLLSFVTQSQSTSHQRPRGAHSVVMRPVNFSLNVRKQAASIGPVPWQHRDRPGHFPRAPWGLNQRMHEQQKHSASISPKPSAVPISAAQFESSGPGGTTFYIEDDLPFVDWVKNLIPRADVKKDPSGIGKNKIVVSAEPGIPLKLSSGLWELLHPFLDRTELLSLSRVCKRLRSVIEHYLYEDLQWMDSDSGGLFQRKPRVCLLLRSILRRPQLAGLIKHISLTAYDKTSTIHLAGSWATSDMILAESFIKKSRLSPDAQLLDRLRYGSCDAIVSLLVSLLWKLETLRVAVGMPNGQRCFVGTVIHLNAFRIYGLRSLDRLKTIELNASLSGIIGTTSSTTEPHEEIAALFVLPSLESVTFTGFRSSIFENHWAIRTDSTRPKTLMIKESYIHESELEQLLVSLSPNLEVLECDFYDYNYTLRQSFDCSALGTALHHIRHSLQRLAITITSTGSDQSLRKYPVRRRIGKLTTYLSLQYLEIPFVLLLGHDSVEARLWDILPKQLQTLCLRHDTVSSDESRWSPEQIVDALTDYVTTAKHLKEVKVTRQEKLDDLKYSNGKSLKEIILKLQESDWPEESKIALKEVCSRSGIDCKIILVPKLPAPPGS